MKITYPLVPYPHTYIALFAPFTKDGGTCHKIWRAKREQRHTPQGDERQVKPQEEYRRTSRSSVKSGRSEWLTGVGIKLWHQPGPMDHQAGAQARGRSNPKVRKTGPQPWWVQRWMLQELPHWQPDRHVNRVLEVRGGDGTSTQPQAQQAPKAGRLKFTTRGGKR